MAEDNLTETSHLRSRIADLEAYVSRLEGDLTAATAKAHQIDQLRNTDQERLFALEMESSKLREQILRIADENESLRGVFRSDHYAGRGQMCIRPNLPAKHLGLHGNRGFLIMPFGPRWSESVEQAVREALRSCGMECHRADQLLGRDIMLDIWSSICECGVIVADVTDCNPNVMYELGLAEAIGKKIVLISQTTDPQRLAFDLLGLRLIVYSPAEKKIEDLSASICRALKASGAPPKGAEALNSD